MVSPLTLGSTSITASAPGYQSSSVPVNIITPTITVTFQNNLTSIVSRSDHQRHNYAECPGPATLRNDGDSYRYTGSRRCQCARPGYFQLFHSVDSGWQHDRNVHADRRRARLNRNSTRLARVFTGARDFVCGNCELTSFSRSRGMMASTNADSSLSWRLRGNDVDRECNRRFLLDKRVGPSKLNLHEGRREQIRRRHPLPLIGGRPKVPVYRLMCNPR